MSDAHSSDSNGVVSFKDSQMVVVSKEFFVDGMTIPVPVYLRFTAENYLLICKKSEKANFTKLHSFKNEQTAVYVRKEDYQVLIHHMTDFTSKIMNTKAVPDSTKVKFLSGLTTHALASFEEVGFGSVAQVEQVSKFVMSLSETLTGFDQILELLAEIPDDESKHAMSTCLMSLMICEQMDISHRAALEKIALGSLLHDIGLKFVPETVMKKPRHLWTPDENSIYEAHPMKGVEMLRDLKDVSNDILLIVAEHHENAIGTGYPKRLRDIKISPLGRVVGLASHFSNLLYSRIPGTKQYEANEALKYIEDILGQPFNKQVFSALKNIINKKFLTDKIKAS
jgi:HD-GYP domain-containing protein (c-di-GMP phosphodiesterase class II)